MFQTVVMHSRFHILNKSNKMNQIICVAVQFGSLENILLSLDICCFNFLVWACGNITISSCTCLILKCRINPNRYHVIEAGGRMLESECFKEGLCIIVWLKTYYFDIAQFLKGFILGI